MITLGSLKCVDPGWRFILFGAIRFEVSQYLFRQRWRKTWVTNVRPNMWQSMDICTFISSGLVDENLGTPDLKYILAVARYVILSSIFLPDRCHSLVHSAILMSAGYVAWSPSRVLIAQYNRRITNSYPQTCHSLLSYTPSYRFMGLSLKPDADVR